MIILPGTVRDPILFAIDYDETFTRDRNLFLAFIQLLRAAGHDAICVTARCRDDDPVTDFPGEVVYTCGAKKAVFADAAGHRIGIWIDDAPHFIGSLPEDFTLPVRTDTMQTDLVKRIASASVASCNCLTKTNVIKYHARTCTYRVLTEALLWIETHADSK